MFGKNKQTPHQYFEEMYKIARQEIKNCGSPTDAIDTPKKFCKRHGYAYADVSTWGPIYENEIQWVRRQLQQ